MSEDDALLSRVALEVTRAASGQEGSLGFGAWELSTAETLGEVMDGIRGDDGLPRHVKEGYQYVGGFPAQLWKLATADEAYKLLSEGIRTFWRRWQTIKPHLTEPLNYVSIGPGTGEKDRAILRHLQEVSGSRKVLYVPVDLSPELLKIAVADSTREVDSDRLIVLPIQLDITRATAMADLEAMLCRLNSGTGMLVSVLGNTLANFRDDAGALARVASVLDPERDRLLVELATTTKADPDMARRAKTEYEGSDRFRRFVMATLSDFTDCTMDSRDSVTYDSVATDGVIQITAQFATRRARKVVFRDGESFELPANEKIELLTTRKYTSDALDRLLRDFVPVKSAPTTYQSEFGLVTTLLKKDDSHDGTMQHRRPHPVGRK